MRFQQTSMSPRIIVLLGSNHYQVSIDLPFDLRASGKSRSSQRPSRKALNWSFPNPKYRSTRN
jgi:hypothetical protein